MAGYPVSRLLIAILLVAGSSTAPAEGDFFRWLAFGDSITLGNYDSPNLGGYPGRLNDLLSCSPGVCEVFNAGKSGEKTYQAVSRIDSVLDDDGPFDVMMLMEGTNDIFVEYPVENAIANLGFIAWKARARGTDTVHASIIWYHPDGHYGTTKDDEVEAIRDGAENLASINVRYFVDIWDVLCPRSHPDVHGHNQTQCFNQHYSDVPNGDDRGHPIGSGYTMMANAFRDGLLSVPLPGAPVPLGPTGTINEERPRFSWDPESPVRATWYQLVVEGDAGVVVDKWLEARSNCGGTFCSYSLSVQEALTSGDYVWRLQGRNPAGDGPWTADIAITVDFDAIFSDGFESGDTAAWSEQQSN